MYPRVLSPGSALGQFMKNTEQQDIDLDNKEFQDAWKLIRFTRQSVFLTGKAGTGKSTFLKYICANTKKKFVVLAPTGIAAVNVGGVTMHSFFKIPFKPILPDDPEFDTRHIKSRMKYSKEFVKFLRALDLIIIDEISMVRADVIDFVDKLLRTYGGNMREPFGGKQMLFVGDIFQLEPVVTGDMRDILGRFYPNPFFFSARAFSNIRMVPIELKKVYRQTDGGFVEMLDRMRSGCPTDDDIRVLNGRLVSRRVSRADDRMVMTIATTRSMVDHINDEHLEALPAAEITYIGEISGDFPENSLPTSKELTLKTGAQVVFVRNDADKRWVNGTIGKVYLADDDRLIVELEDGSCHNVEPVIWSNIKYEFDEDKNKVVERELGSFKQFPVKLAWALTIHKSQGLTFNDVVVDIGSGTFSGGQAYVALSRCRSLEGLALASTINRRDVFINPAVVKFSRTFNDTALIDEALDRAKADDLYAKALAAIDRDDVAGAFDLFVEAMRARSEIGNPAVMRFARSRLSRLLRYKTEAEKLAVQVADHSMTLHRLASEYLSMARECRNEGMDPVPVFANYDKAISIAPDYAEAWLEKGTLSAELGDYDDAVASLGKAYEIDKENVVIPYELGKLWLSRGDCVQALDWGLIALKLDEERSATHQLLAEIYTRVGEENAAAHHASLARKFRRRKKK